MLSAVPKRVMRMYLGGPGETGKERVMGAWGDWGEGGDKREEESRCPRSELVPFVQQEGRPFA